VLDVQWIDEKLMKDTRLHGSRFFMFLLLFDGALDFCIDGSCFELHCGIVPDGWIDNMAWLLDLHALIDAWMLERNERTK
jgi:hypothetical protein